MNLENLNLVELNAREVQETEGGILPIVILGVTITKSGLLKAGVVAAAASLGFYNGCNT